jgi:hypothetical protein
MKMTAGNYCCHFYFILCQIAIHKKHLYEGNSNYLKRTQRDYSISLKLQIVKEIERGKLSISQASKNYGIQSRSQ